MITFRYQAKTGAGQTVEGVVTALSPEEAQLQLARSGIFVLGMEPIQPSGDDEAIIFSGGGGGPSSLRQGEEELVRKKGGFDSDKVMTMYENLVQELLDTKGELIEMGTESELRLQLTKMKYLREHFSENVWKRQKQVLDRLLRHAQREIERNELRRWEGWGREEGDADGGYRAGIFSGFSNWWKTERGKRTSKITPVWSGEQVGGDLGEGGGHEAFEEKGGVVFGGGADLNGGDLHEESSSIRKIRYWYRVMNRPNVAKQEEVYAKARYEAVWLELQRFIGALLAFYLVTSFFAYQFLQQGDDAVLLVKVYKTAMFKQIVIFLFAAYGLLTLRRHFLKKHLIVDGVLFCVWVGVLWMLISG